MIRYHQVRAHRLVYPYHGIMYHRLDIPYCVRCTDLSDVNNNSHPTGSFQSYPLPHKEDHKFTKCVLTRTNNALFKMLQLTDVDCDDAESRTDNLGHSLHCSPETHCSSLFHPARTLSCHFPYLRSIIQRILYMMPDDSISASTLSSRLFELAGEALSKGCAEGHTDIACFGVVAECVLILYWSICSIKTVFVSIDADQCKSVIGSVW